MGRVTIKTTKENQQEHRDSSYSSKNPEHTVNTDVSTLNQHNHSVNTVKTQCFDSENNTHLQTVVARVFDFDDTRKLYFQSQKRPSRQAISPAQ